MIEKRPIPGFEGKYWLTSVGQVYNREGHELKTLLSNDGTKQVELRKDGQRDLIPIDVLMAITWR